jgi:hypothetical protein
LRKACAIALGVSTGTQKTHVSDEAIRTR